MLVFGACAKRKCFLTCLPKLRALCDNTAAFPTSLSSLRSTVAEKCYLVLTMRASSKLSWATRASMMTATSIAFNAQPPSPSL